MWIYHQYFEKQPKHKMMGTITCKHPETQTIKCTVLYRHVINYLQQDLTVREINTIRQYSLSFTYHCKLKLLIIGKTRLTSTICIIYIMYLIESSLNIFICSQLRLVERELNTLTIHKFRDINTKDIAQYDHCNSLLSIQFP